MGSPTDAGPSTGSVTAQSREADKVARWVAEAKELQQQTGEDAVQVLLSTLEMDIQEEIRQGSQRRKQGTANATQRLYKDAQRRLKTASPRQSPCGTTSADSTEVREMREMKMKNNNLLAEMQAKKQSEVKSLNLKMGIHEKPALFTVGSPDPRRSLSVPEKSYQQLLYEEGMIGFHELRKWREEGKVLLTANEVQQCTFAPNINAESRAIAERMSSRPLSERTREVLEEKHAKLQALKNDITSEEHRHCTWTPQINDSRDLRKPKKKAKDIFESFEHRQEVSTARRQQLKAQVELQKRHGETFTPAIKTKERNMEAEQHTHPHTHLCPTKAKPHKTHDRLHHIHSHRQLKVKEKQEKAEVVHIIGASKLSAEQRDRVSSSLYAEAKARQARHDERKLQQELQAKEAAAMCKISERTKQLATKRDTRDLQAIFESMGILEGGVTSPDELRELLERLGLLPALGGSPEPERSERVSIAPTTSALNPEYAELEARPPFTTSSVVQQSPRNSSSPPLSPRLSPRVRSPRPVEPPLEAQLWFALAEKSATEDEGLATPKEQGGISIPPNTAISFNKFCAFLLGDVEVPPGLISKTTSAAVLALQRLHCKGIGKFKAEASTSQGDADGELTFSPRLLKTPYHEGVERIIGPGGVHETLYQKSSEIRQHKEKLRIELAKDKMEGYTFTPDLSLTTQEDPDTTD